jgi:hypothetical protein
MLFKYAVELVKQTRRSLPSMGPFIMCWYSVTVAFLVAAPPCQVNHGGTSAVILYRYYRVHNLLNVISMGRGEMFSLQ